MTVTRWIGILRRHPRPGRLIAARLLAWSGLSHLLTMPLDGYRLRLYPSNATLNLWINPGSRMHGLQLFRDYCAPGDLVADVGANVGEVSIIASQRVGAGGHVYAFEPSPRVHRYLQGNLTLNDCRNVTTFNLALGAEAGSVRLSDDRRDDMNRVVTEGGTAVACSTLDQELPAGVPIALLKIDVEGTELRVLQGGLSALARTACVNCEMWEEHFLRYGYHMGDLIRFLSSQGFATFVMGPTCTLRAVDASFAEPGGHELVAVRDREAFVARTGWRIEPPAGAGDVI